MTDIKLPTVEEWIAALRSGEYQQHCGDLFPGANVSEQNGTLTQDIQNQTHYCCIGVYGMLTAKAGFNFERAKESYALVEELGICTTKELWTRNDGTIDKYPHTFSQIADYIEQQMKEKANV